jgi:glycosyltransferase involved in cell wall biosynthesis
MNKETCKASVVIPTCNRGDSVVATLETVLANTHPSFEVILIDQSKNDETENAVEHFKSDSRFRYVRFAARGAGRSRHLGLSEARGEVVLYTDDDCTVPSDWIEKMTGIFNSNPRVAVVFCNVDPAPHDQVAGFIPAYQRQDSKIVRNMWDKCQARGIGAGYGVRREMALAIGGFDRNLGPGSMFPSCDDGDIAVRALINKHWVYETHETGVLHYGFRTWEQGKELTKRDWRAIGGSYVKPLKCGHWDISIVIAYEAFVMGFWKPLSNIFRLKKPQGIRRFVYFWQGFFQGLKLPVDRKTLVYNLD